MTEEEMKKAPFSRTPVAGKRTWYESQYSAHEIYVKSVSILKLEKNEKIEGKSFQEEEPWYLVEGVKLGGYGECHTIAVPCNKWAITG